MTAILLEISIILLLLLLNGIFAMSEMALVAARRTRLEHRAEEGDAGARVALELAAHPTNFLSTVQIGITFVGVMAGAFGGVGIGERLADWLETFPALEPYADAIGFGLVVAVITYLSLIIGELVPKQIALSSPERVAARVARPMRMLARIGGPLVRLLTGSTQFVFRTFGIRTTIDPRVTEQDIRAALEQGAEAGVVEEAEHEIIEKTFRLGDRQVASVMTPRPDMAWLEVDADASELRERLERAPGRPIVVCAGDVDRVLGVVYPEVLLLRCVGGESVDLRASLHAPLFVPVTMPVLRLLEEFRRTRQHAAVVLDEFGGVQGVAVLEDVLEALVGEVPEPGDPAPMEIVRQGDGSWLVDGGVAIEDLEAELGADPRLQELARGYHTVAGLIIAGVGRLPHEGDFVEEDGWRYEVVRVHGRRIVTVRVRRVDRWRPLDGDPTFKP